MHMRALLLYPMIFGRRIHFFFYKQEAKMRPTKKQIILAASDSPRVRFAGLRFKIDQYWYQYTYIPVPTTNTTKIT